VKRAYLSLLLLAGCPELGDPKKEVSALTVRADRAEDVSVRVDRYGGDLLLGVSQLWAASEEEQR
jgi:hypothetical protein